MIVADNGSGWYLSGEPSSRWDDDDLHDLAEHRRHATSKRSTCGPSSRDVLADSGAAAGGTSVTIVGRNFSGAAGQLQVFFGTAAAANVAMLSDSTLVVTTPLPQSGHGASHRRHALRHVGQFGGSQFTSRPGPQSPAGTSSTISRRGTATVPPSTRRATTLPSRRTRRRTCRVPASRRPPTSRATRAASTASWST